MQDKAKKFKLEKLNAQPGTSGANRYCRVQVFLKFEGQRSKEVAVLLPTQQPQV